MALDIVAQDIIVDETTGLQDDDTSASNATITYLLSLDGLGGLDTPQVAYQSDFVVASADAGEVITSVTLTQSLGGTAFSTTDGVNSGIRTVDGNYVWLFLDSTHSNVVIGVIGTSDPTAEPAESGPLAFSFALVSTSATHYDLYTAQYVPLLHPDATDPDDQIDLSDKVFATISGSTTVSFTGANAPPGKHDFYLLDSPTDGSKQILVTGFLGGANAIPNVSTQGFGVDNQSINPTEKLQVDFVTGGTLHAGSASQIQYGSHVETITQAGFTINQITPSSPDKRVDITITALNVQGNEQGLNFYDGSTTTNAPITSITLTGQSGVTGAITANGTYDVAGSVDVTVSGIGTNVVTITGLDNITTVDVTTSSSFDRLVITGVDANEGCDITEFHYSTTTPNGHTEEVGSFVNFDDDGPTLSGGTVTKAVGEDALTGLLGGDLSTGIPDAGDTKTDEVSFSYSEIAGLVTPGADTPALPSLTSSFTAGTAVKDVDGNTITSNGETVFWAVSSGVVQGVAGSGGSQRVIFTITDDSANSEFDFDLKDQIDHHDSNGDPLGDEGTITLDLTPAFSVTDKDLDPATLTGSLVKLDVENDVAIISAQISSDTLDWVDDNSVTGSLHGLAGADDSAGYIIDKYTDLAGYTETLSGDGKTLTYSIGGTTYFTLALDDDANGGAGGYTFTVNEPPPATQKNLDFTDLPSGQNLFGIIAFDKTNIVGGILPDGGLLVTPNNAILDSGGVFTTNPKSGTMNTSKGGGPVTIGNGNQMFDALGEGAWFTYVDDQTTAGTAGVGLNQGNADDADTISFNGTNAATTASVEIVQAQGKGGVGMHIVTYDLTFLSAVDTDAEARLFCVNPTTTNEDNAASAVDIAVQVNIESVVVKLGNTVLESVENNGTAGGNVLIDDSKINVIWTQDSAGVWSVDVRNLGANMTVEFETSTPHDTVQISNVQGKYDIGGFNIITGQDTPDVDLQFSVAVVDADGDLNHYAETTEVFDDFKIKVDGTGGNNDPSNVDPTGFSTSYDSPSDYLI